MTRGELTRRLRGTGLLVRRTAKGGHRQLVHPETKKVITVSVHTSKEVGTGLAHRNHEGGGVVIEHYPVVVERESNGTFSAWVAGLPGVYAVADTAVAAKRGIRSALAGHLEALTALGQDLKPQADLLVLRHDSRARTRRERLRFVGPGALMGKKTTAAKAEAARRNGRKGGRPAERTKLSSQA